MLAVELIHPCRDDTCRLFGSYFYGLFRKSGHAKEGEDKYLRWLEEI
jgi:hypothetical protein